jgi:hypothetical protein
VARVKYTLLLFAFMCGDHYWHEGKSVRTSSLLFTINHTFYAHLQVLKDKHSKRVLFLIGAEYKHQLDK